MQNLGYCAVWIKYTIIATRYFQSLQILHQTENWGNVDK